MYTVKVLPAFTTWLDNLSDPAIQAIIAARLRRLEQGLPGDVKPVGGGVSELRIHVGAGWRVYYMRRGRSLLVVLGGGGKATQRVDINKALKAAALLD
jgi:putative addiction module killer protein